MKTNQILKRNEYFFQRIKDGYFNATLLINGWNLKHYKKKMLGNYQKNNSTTDFVSQLKKEGIEKPYVTGRGKGDDSGTWMHPKLFIDFVMWVSLEFKSSVIDCVMYGLTYSENDAGDYYNQMCAQILKSYIEHYGRKPPAQIFISEARLVRDLVTEKSRNEMNEVELRQITYLQKVNTNLIRKDIGKEKRIKRLIEASEIQI